MTTDIAIREEPTHENLLPDRAVARAQLQAVREFQATVRELFVKGHDYGEIPGTGNKPTLLKPGAEKLAKLLKLADTYDIIERIEDWDRPLFRYVVRCTLTLMGSTVVVSQGLGECNSYESKYRWRWVWANEVSKEQRDHLRTVPGRSKKINTRRGESEMFRLENDDIYSQINTLLKMAKKRALVDAALSAGRLSDLFTQDLEDLPQHAGGVADSSAYMDAEDATQEAPRQSEPRRPTKAMWDKWAAMCERARQEGLTPPDLGMGTTYDQMVDAATALKELLDTRAEERQEELPA